MVFYEILRVHCDKGRGEVERSEWAIGSRHRYSAHKCLAAYLRQVEAYLIEENSIPGRVSSPGLEAKQDTAGPASLKGIPVP